MREVRKNFILIIFCIFTMLLITSCGGGECNGHHDMNNDGLCETCKQEYKIEIECPSCGEINDALSEKCHKCGYVLEVLKKCSICKKLTSKYLNSCDKCHNELYIQCVHKWEDATYLKPKTCVKCNLTGGEALSCEKHVDSDENEICDVCKKSIYLNYKSKWKPNQQTGGWYGNNMTIKIQVLPKHEYDPFDAGYNKDDKKIMQKQIRLVEAAYGVKIVYENWSDLAPWGPQRVEYIKSQTQSGEFANNDVYVINIVSSWIPTLVKSGCLAELASITSDGDIESGIFTEIGYQETFKGSKIYQQGTYMQSRVNNCATSTLQKVYGYVHGEARPDTFLYYNADLIASANMQDPAELWLKGEWTWSNFEQYCKQLQAKLPSDSYALSVGFPEFIIGSVPAAGNKIITPEPYLGFNSTDVIEKLNNIQDLYTSGIYEKRDYEDVSKGFLEKRVAIVHGDLWFIGESNRFDPEKCDFTIGAVPYPTADNEGGEPIITTDENEAILGYNGKPIELTEGSKEYISGVDMSKSSFLIPILTVDSCFSIIDTINGKNGINNKIIFGIIYDLYEGLGDNPIYTNSDTDELYYKWLLTRFDLPLYAKVIMSVQNKSYFDLTEVVSMTVGGGSHFGSNAFWPLIKNICVNADINPQDRLNEVIVFYEEALKAMGYMENE